MLEIETLTVKHLINQGINPYETNIEEIAETVRTAIKNQQFDFEEVDLKALTDNKAPVFGVDTKPDDFYFASYDNKQEAPIIKMQFILTTIETAVAETIANELVENDDCL